MKGFLNCLVLVAMLVSGAIAGTLPDTSRYEIMIGLDKDGYACAYTQALEGWSLSDELPQRVESALESWIGESAYSITTGNPRDYERFENSTTIIVEVRGDVYVSWSITSHKEAADTTAVFNLRTYLDLAVREWGVDNQLPRKMLIEGPGYVVNDLDPFMPISISTGSVGGEARRDALVLKIYFNEEESSFFTERNAIADNDYLLLFAEDIHSQLAGFMSGLEFKEVQAKPAKPNFTVVVQASLIGDSLAFAVETRPLNNASLVVRALLERITRLWADDNNFRVWRPVIIRPKDEDF